MAVDEKPYPLFVDVVFVGVYLFMSNTLRVQTDSNTIQIEKNCHQTIISFHVEYNLIDGTSKISLRECKITYICRRPW